MSRGPGTSFPFLVVVMGIFAIVLGITAVARVAVNLAAQQTYDRLGELPNGASVEHRRSAFGTLALPFRLEQENASAIATRAFRDRLAAGDLEGANAALKVADASLRNALAQGPAAPHLWFALARLQTIQHGFDGAAGRHLEASFLTGPMDGRILAERLKFGISVWPLLDAGLKGHVLRDFQVLTETNYGMHQLRKLLDQPAFRRGFCHVNEAARKEIKILAARRIVRIGNFPVCPRPQS